MSPKEAADLGITLRQDGKRRSGSEMLALPQVDTTQLLPIWPDMAGFSADIVRQIEIDAMYASYVERQKKDVDVLKRDEMVSIPADFSYETVPGLSKELSGKLERARPETLHQAGNIDGMTPAALTAILVQLKVQEKKAG